MALANKEILRYLAPAATADSPHITELTIKKSRFLASSCRCVDAQSARRFIAGIKAANPAASHNCWAFSASQPGQTSISGSSDDGEPHGTAGRPMLQVLLGCDCAEICMVVSRWFGGIKLGTGGLVKAYQQAARENLLTLPRCEVVSREYCRVTLDYAYMDAAKKFFAAIGAIIEMEDYAERVKFDLAVPKDRLFGFQETLSELSNGSAVLETACLC